MLRAVSALVVALAGCLQFACTRSRNTLPPPTAIPVEPVGDTDQHAPSQTFRSTDHRSPAKLRTAVDPAIEPVSRSEPSADAQQAMDVCNVGVLGLDAIAGMALIEAAIDALTLLH